MASIESFLKYILKVEGRKSSDAADSASKCYPGGVHTNKGITFCRWQNHRKKIGKSSTYQSFLNMTDQDYAELVYFGYFDNDDFKGFWKTFESRPIAALFLIDWAYNRGNSGMERDLAKFQREKMGIVDNNITIPEILTNIRTSQWSDHLLLVSLFYRRIKIYNDIVKQNPSLNKYLNGWKNRVKKFYLQFAPSDVLQTLRSQGVDFSGL